MKEPLPAIRINKRAKRIILRHDPLRGFTLTISAKSKIQQALQLWRDFLVSPRNALPHTTHNATLISPGFEIPLQGETYAIQKAESVLLRKVEVLPAPSSAANDSVGKILICASATNPNHTIKEFLYHFAQQVLFMKSTELAKNAGVSFQKIAVKDMRSRWGSCSKSGNLSYSWRILMAPEPVIDYLCAHEVSHLKHFDHSKDFWALVEFLCPNAKTHRKWLKDNGATLMRYQFDL